MPSSYPIDPLRTFAHARMHRNASSYSALFAYCRHQDSCLPANCAEMGWNGQGEWSDRIHDSFMQINRDADRSVSNGR